MATSISGQRTRRHPITILLAALSIALGWLLVAGPPAAADGPTTFSNTGSIAIPASGSADQLGPAAPYPSAVEVSGMAGPVTNVTVTFHGLSHATVNDIDAMVVAPTGQNLVVLSDIGDPESALAFANNATLTFDDAAAGEVPIGNIPSGTYRPTSRAPVDSFPAPAPAPSSQTTLTGAFTGLDPNGTWQLFVVDDSSGDLGTMTGGWSLTITTESAAVATTTTVVTSGTPSILGEPVTFTATVTGAGNPVTTGLVQFTDGGTALGSVALDASGTASLTTAALIEGSHEIRATYGGAPGFLPSNGAVTQRVDNATVVSGDTFCNPGAITVPSQGVAQPYPSNITVAGLDGQLSDVTVSLTGLSHQVPVDLDIMLAGPTPAQNVTLLSDSGGTTAVTGLDVTFDDAAAGTVPTPLTSGTFRPTDDDANGPDSFPAPAPPQSAATGLSTFDGINPNGVWSLWVIDDASADLGSIAGGWCITVTTPEATDTALASSLNPSTAGTEVVFTATITAGGSPVSAGVVQFSDGATALGAPVPVGLDGTASLTISDLAVGAHAVQAAYAGTAELAPSSAVLNQVVDPAPTTTTIGSDLNPSSVGQAVTFTAEVTSGAGPVGTGAVTFSVDGTAQPPVAVDAAGIATFSTATLTAGTHTITAAYGGDASLAASNAELQQVVNQIATATVLTSDINPSTFGTGVTFTAIVTAGGSPVTSGEVQFSNGGTALGAPVPVGPDGTAGFTTAELTAGSHGITAAYGGTDALAASSADLTQVVDQLATTVALTSEANPSTVGQSVTFTAAVASGAGPATTGSVTFSVDGIGQPAVSVDAAGNATFSTPTLTPGAHTITAAYGGDANLAASTAQLQQVVNPVADAGGPYQVAEGGDLTLGASGGPAGATYDWDLNGDADFTDATGAAPTLTWAQLQALGIDDGPTSDTITVRITVGGSTATDTATLVVTNTAPAVVVDGDRRATVGVALTLKVGADDPSATDMSASFTYIVDWGDGSPAQTVIGPADPPVTHTYASAGQFNASFTATDKDGGQGGPLVVVVVVSPQQITPTPTPTPPGPTPTGPAYAVHPVLVLPPGGGGSLAQTGLGTGLGAIAVSAALIISGGALLLVARRRRLALDRQE